MLRAALVAAGALLAIIGSAKAQGDSRWALEIRGPIVAERGELRLEGQGGRLLLESADSAWLPLRDFRVTEGRIAFTLPSTGRRFDGVLLGASMQGMVHDPDGRLLRWSAERIPPGIHRWPVRPRVQVRQLLLGMGADGIMLPSAWRAAFPLAATLVAERDSLARAAGLRAPTRIDLVNAQRVALGFDSAGRAVARALLSRIANGPVADDAFRRLFGTAEVLRFDLHQVAFTSASAKGALPPALARGLGVFAPGAPLATDTLSLYAAAWRAWSRVHTDTTESQMLLDAMAVRDPEAFRAVRAVFTGYDESVGWWVDALQWLLTHPWIDTPSGRRSPADLVADFWGQPFGSPPPLEPTHFGSVQSVPVVGAARLGSKLIRPLNASASEWLAQDGLAEALAVWRAVDSNDTLALVRGGRSVNIIAPAAVARSRLGGFLSGRDAIRIEPGIAPIFAVATVLHEWQHLRFEGARLEGTAPGLVEGANELTLRDGNPWLAEGAAEWATEALLAPARSSTPLLPLMEAIKRGSIALTGADDPHPLGYLLVRTLAGRSTSPALLRTQLIRLLHDPLALAREYRLDTAIPHVEPIRLTRPPGAGIIPEIAFLWDDGVAEQLSRRVLISDHPQEH